jgi:hypothetical protein
MNLIVVPADPGEVVTLAARVRHDVVVVAGSKQEKTLPPIFSFPGDLPWNCPTCAVHPGM